MKKEGDARLGLLLKMLREYHDVLIPRLGRDNAASCINIERMCGDAVMFNLGWHAAAGAAELKGSTATEPLLEKLLDVVEHAANLAKADMRVAELEQRLAEMDSKPGRRKGSFEPWHFEPGYQVVVALIETQPDKKAAEHIRWAVKKGWLDKNMADKTHARRVGLIQKRHRSEQAAHLAALGKNVVPFKPRKARKPLH